MEQVAQLENLLKRWIDQGWNAQNLEIIPEIFSEEYEASGGSSNIIGSIHGHEGLRQYAKMTFDAFSDLYVEILELYVCGDIAMLSYQFTGTHTGSLNGEEPTGNQLDIHGVDVFQFEDGLIIKRLVANYDANLLNSQLGL